MRSWVKLMMILQLGTDVLCCSGADGWGVLSC